MIKYELYFKSKLETKRIGENIAVARKRRKMTVSELSLKASVSRMVLMRIEKGDPSVGVGKLFNVLSALGLLSGISDLTDPMNDVSQTISEINHAKSSLKGKKTFNLVKKKKKLDF